VALHPNLVRRNNREYGRPILYALSALAIVTGLWLMRDGRGFGELFARLAALNPFRSEAVLLTGLDRAGRIEVPIINLWEQPGFGRDNRVAARIPLPASGQVAADRVGEIELDGLTWNQVRVNDARGWVISRFVRSVE
jgi:hypothetical protein